MGDMIDRDAAVSCVTGNQKWLDMVSAIRALPAATPAPDAAAIREAALKEALAEFDVQVLEDVSHIFDYPMLNERPRTLEEVHTAILALLEKPHDRA